MRKWGKDVGAAALGRPTNTFSYGYWKERWIEIADEREV